MKLVKEIVEFYQKIGWFNLNGLIFGGNETGLGYVQYIQGIQLNVPIPTFIDILSE